MMHEIQSILSFTAALIPAASTTWFVVAIANKIFTRCQMARRQQQLVQVSRAIATSATKPPQSLLVQPFIPSEVVTPKSAPTVPTGTDPYQNMPLSELRKLGRKRNIQPTGDARKRESWIDALVCHQ